MKIETISIEQVRLSPSVAEMKVIVRTDGAAGNVQLRGGLTGPRCPGRETIQIAHPIRIIAAAGDDDRVLWGRIAIPEPNLWTEESPYVYEGEVELWQAGEKLDSRPIRAAFRATAN